MSLRSATGVLLKNQPILTATTVRPHRGSGILFVTKQLIWQPPSTVLQGVFAYNFGQSDIFVPTEDEPTSKTNKILSQSDYTDMFVDIDNHNYNLKNPSSKIFMAGYSDDSFSAEAARNTFDNDLSGYMRPGPEISIGALELTIIFEFDGSYLNSIQDGKLKYMSASESGHTNGAFVSDIDGKDFVRAVNRFYEWENPYDYSLENKLIFSLEPIPNRNFVSEKKYKTLYEFDALYELSNNTIIIQKTQKFNAGLFLNMIGNAQYIFTYNETNRTITIGIFEKLTSGMSGIKSVINAVKFGR